MSKKFLLHLSHLFESVCCSSLAYPDRGGNGVSALKRVLMRSTGKAIREIGEITIIKLAGGGKDRYQEGGEVYKANAAMENSVVRTQTVESEGFKFKYRLHRPVAK